MACVLRYTKRVKIFLCQIVKATATPDFGSSEEFEI